MKHNETPTEPMETSPAEATPAEAAPENAEVTADADAPGLTDEAADSAHDKKPQPEAQNDGDVSKLAGEVRALIETLKQNAEREISQKAYIKGRNDAIEEILGETATFSPGKAASARKLAPGSILDDIRPGFWDRPDPVRS